MNSFDERPLTKVNAFDGDSADGIIILAALRRRGANFRGKYKKLIEVTTEKVVKVTSDATVKVTTEEVVKVTTEKAVKVTTEKVVKLTTEEAVKVTSGQKIKLMTKARRNQLTNEDTLDPLWIARKRVTRAPQSIATKKSVMVNVVDEEEYSLRRARYLFSLRSGK